jgi:hypothetical protein
MKTHVVYKYRAPGSDPDQDDEMKTEAMPYKPEMALALIHAEGQTFSLWSDYPDKYGDQPKDYKVVERYIEPGIKNKLNVIVTDPDSKQASYRIGALALARTPAPPGPPESPETAAESPESSTMPKDQQEPKSEPEQRRSRLYRFFFGPSQWQSGPRSSRGSSLGDSY